MISYEISDIINSLLLKVKQSKAIKQVLFCARSPKVSGILTIPTF